MTAIEIRDPKVTYRTADSWIDVFTGTVTPANLFPTEATVGVNGIPGWEPAVTIGPEVGGYEIRDAGAVIEDMRVYGNMACLAPHITVRRCELINGSFFNTYSGVVYNGMLLEDCTVRCDPPASGLPANKAIGDAGYTCRRCAIIDTTEGWRTGGSIGSGYVYADPDVVDATRVRIYDSYCRISSPNPCYFDTDYHGDGLQSFDGGLGGVPITMRNVNIKAIDRETDDGSGSCASNSCIILGAAQSGPYDFDRILMSGSAIPYRVEPPGRATKMLIEHNSWIQAPGYRPTNIDWSVIEEADWSGYTCLLDGNGQPVTIVNTIPYGWPGFGPMDPPPAEWPL